MEVIKNETATSQFIRYGDKRVLDWPLMESPIGLLCILGLYFIVIYRWGPAYMEKRKPFNIKSLLAVYNLGQVAACFFLIQGFLRNDDAALLFWKCKAVDFTTNPQAVKVLQLTYCTFLLKLVELVETVFFVMRKKQNQISKLHVYHHASTAILSWIMVRYHGGGMILFSVILNSFVHVIMYSYYFAALFGPAVQQKLEKIKKNITVIQMVQFSLILTQCGIGLAKRCDIPTILIAIYIPNVVLIFYMFYDFFSKAYTKKNVHTKTS